MFQQIRGEIARFTNLLYHNISDITGVSHVSVRTMSYMDILLGRLREGSNETLPLRSYAVFLTAPVSFISHPRIFLFLKLEGKYSLESIDPRESEIRAPLQPQPYLMPIPPTRFFITKNLSQPFCC